VLARALLALQEESYIKLQSFHIELFVPIKKKEKQLFCAATYSDYESGVLSRKDYM
jgi:hypothetical protein